MTATQWRDEVAEMGRGPTISPLVRGGLRFVYRKLSRTRAIRLLEIPAVEWARCRITTTRVRNADVLNVMRALRGADVEATVFGGWACDAVLGKRSRQHHDLDLIIREIDEEQAVRSLVRSGFSPVKQFETGPWFSVGLDLIDRRRRLGVTLHMIDLDSKEPDGWQASLRAGAGAIGLDPDCELFTSGWLQGQPVSCLSPSAQLVVHTGYEPDDTDRRDVRLLCARFSLPLPPGYHPNATI